MIIPDKTTESCKCLFTHEELWEKAKALSRESGELTEIENEKKQVTADFGARIASCRARIAQLYTHINNGYEYRTVTCSVLLDVPEKGKKTIFRDDTGEHVRVANMTSEEKQRALPFDKPADITSEENVIAHFGASGTPDVPAEPHPNADPPEEQPAAEGDQVATPDAARGDEPEGFQDLLDEPDMAFDAEIPKVETGPEPEPEPNKPARKTRRGRGFGGRGMIHG